MCSNLVLKTEHTFPRFHCFNQRSCHLLNKQERKPLQKAGLTLFVQAMAVDPHNPFLPRVDACLNHSRARRDKQSSARSWFQDPNQRAMHSPTLNTSHVLGFLLSDWMALLTIETVLHPIRIKIVRQLDTERRQKPQLACFLVAASSMRSFAAPESMNLVIPPASSTWPDVQSQSGVDSLHIKLPCGIRNNPQQCQKSGK